MTAIITCLIIYVVGAFSFATIEDRQIFLDKQIKQDIQAEKEAIKKLKGVRIHE